MVKQTRVAHVTEVEFKSMEGKECPCCAAGVLIQEMIHDAITGNESILKCNVANPCGFTVQVRG